MIPLAEQDRTRWDRSLIAEGVALASEALPRGAVGPYPLQAAIAAVHDEASTMEDTDWPQILGLYELLESVEPNPMTTLNRAVATAMAHGPEAGLALIATLESDGAQPSAPGDPGAPAAPRRRPGRRRGRLPAKPRGAPPASPSGDI